MFDPRLFDGTDDYKLVSGWVLLFLAIIVFWLILGFGYMVGAAFG